MIDYHTLMERFSDLQAYVGWEPVDAVRVRALTLSVRPSFTQLVNDFYQEIERHEGSRRVITGGQTQIERLKGTLNLWLEDLFSGDYGTDYVARHYRIGRRHVEIGLQQVYVFAALSRLRRGLNDCVNRDPALSWEEKAMSLASLQKLLDLDAALIESAYDEESLMRQQASERMRSDTLFRNVVDSAGCLMIVARQDQSMAFANNFATNMLQIGNLSQGTQVFITKHIAQEDLPNFLTNFERALTGQCVLPFEGSLLTSEGQKKAFLWNMRPLEQYDAEKLVVLVVGQDISLLLEAQNQALQAERLAVIGRMSAGLAHEGRNALQRLQACTEMLEYEVENKPETMDLVRRMQLAQDQLLKMFDEVRGYAGPIKLDTVACNVVDTWREAWNLLEHERRNRQATLHEEIACRDLECLLDRFRITQLFRNLLENALAACADPVEIIIHCQKSEWQGKPAIRIAVRDNGPGLNPEQRRRIFEPFFTTKSRGTGLGMPIAQRIVEAHGGFISVGSEWEAGAEIIVTLLLNR